MSTTGSNHDPAHPREAEVIEALRTSRPITRAAIAEATGLSRTTVSAVIAPLLEEGTVVVAGHEDHPGRGRPTERIEIDLDAISALGIDLAHGAVRIAALNIVGDTLTTGSREHPEDLGWEERLGIVRELLEELALPAAMPSLRGVGLGVPGPAAFLHRADAPWQRLVDDLQGRFGAEVRVDNTTRYAAFAEHLAAPRRDRITLHVRCYQGVGGAVVREARIDRGAAGLAGEIGHLQVEFPGAPCRCGRRGCLETVASTPSVLAACRALGLGLHTVEQLHQELASGRGRVDPVLTRAAEGLAHALVLAVTMVDPEEILLSGDLFDAGDALLDRVRGLVAREAGARFPAVRLGPGRLSSDAGALGAALPFTHPRPSTGRTVIA